MEGQNQSFAIPHEDLVWFNQYLVPLLSDTIDTIMECDDLPAEHKQSAMRDHVGAIRLLRQRFLQDDTFTILYNTPIEVMSDTLYEKQRKRSRTGFKMTAGIAYAVIMGRWKKRVDGACVCCGRVRCIPRVAAVERMINDDEEEGSDDEEEGSDDSEEIN